MKTAYLRVSRFESAVPAVTRHRGNLAPAVTRRLKDCSCGYSSQKQFLSEKLQEDAVKLIDVLQEAKSDPLGIGRRVRAFHPEVLEKGDWNDTFSEIKIKPDLKVEIKRTGILKNTEVIIIFLT